MMVVMMATVMEAKREVCTVDVGRRTTSEPEAFQAERWEVEEMVRKNWLRSTGGMVSGSVTLRCGSKDISLLNLDNLRNPWKAINKIRNEQDDEEEEWELLNQLPDDAQDPKTTSSSSPCKSMCVVEVATEKGGAPGVMNLDKKRRRKLEHTLLKLLERPDAAILMSCSNQQYWFIKWSLLRKRLPEFTTAIDKTGKSCGFHPQAFTATPTAPAPVKPGVPAPARPGVPAPAKPGVLAPATPGVPAPAQPTAPAPARPAVLAPAPANPKA
ncbi:hypothetical protein Pmani_024389 [Petrolisthes manimaculis]|uniref:Uncharacterized protein n=1 Tax=Petrolisthes manimaculis TaxID=1843537 RepID=A0AAE1PAF3_9EUCA|nr:hypothetical protein Pmani_024389 [Petrolisthes manimaculis]